MPTSPSQKYPSRLLILSASGRALAESAIRAGFTVDVVDQFADWDLQQLGQLQPTKLKRSVKFNDFDEMLVATDWNSIDGTVVAGGFENRIEQVRRLESRTRLLGTSSINLGRLQRASSLATIGAAVKSAGGQYPENRFVLSASEIAEHWLKKRLIRAGGKHVTVANNFDCLDRGADLCSPANGMEREYFFQRRIEGENVAAVFAATPAGNPTIRSRASQSQLAACQLIGCSKQLVGDPNLGASSFSYCGSIGPLSLALPIQYTIAAIGQALAAEFGIGGVFGIDFIVNANGVWPVDINPRMPASAEIFEMASRSGPAADQMSMMRIHVEACMGNVCESMSTHDTQELVGKAILFCQSSVGIRIEQNTHLRLRTYYPGQEFRRPLANWIADIPQAGTLIKSGDPILSLFTRGESESCVYQNLMSLTEQVRSIIDPVKRKC